MQTMCADCSNTEKVELEDQFILRLPRAEADFIRNVITMKPKKLSKKLRLNLDPESGEAIVIVSGKILHGRLRKLPTIVESLKTYNKSVFIKTADICQILDCVDLRVGLDSNHGLTPPLKNVKKKRFRKCLINRDEASVNVQKELFFLLQADLEAVSTKFEIMYPETVIAGPDTAHKEKSQIELFGNVLTDSEETESNVEEVET